MRLTIRHGRVEPFRDGGFVVVNRLRVTFADVDVVLEDRPPTTGAPPPLARLVARVAQILPTFMPAPPPRQYTVETIAEEVFDRSVAEVVLQRFRARMQTGAAVTTVRADRVGFAAGAEGPELDSLVIETNGPAGRLEARTARLTPDGVVVALDYRLAPGSAARHGGPAAFAVDGAHGRLVRAAMPPAVGSGADTLSISTLMNPLLRRWLPAVGGPAASIGR